MWKIIETIKDILGEIFFDKSVRVWALVFIICGYILGVHVIQRSRNPQLTETELIILLPKNIFLEFQESE